MMRPLPRHCKFKVNSKQMEGLGENGIGSIWQSVKKKLLTFYSQMLAIYLDFENLLKYSS